MTRHEEAIEALRLTLEEIEEEEALARESGDEEPRLGKYGIMFWDYQKEEHASRFEFLILEAELREVCLQVEKEALELMEELTEKLRRSIPRPNAAEDYMAAVRYETMIRDQAEEVVLREIVYRVR
jgi:hypothetical protein